MPGFLNFLEQEKMVISVQLNDDDSSSQALIDLLSDIGHITILENPDTDSQFYIRIGESFMVARPQSISDAIMQSVREQIKLEQEK
jgi:hypothetical protein